MFSLWNYGTNKILKIIRVIDSELDKVIALHRGECLIELIKAYNELKAVTSIPACQFGSAIFPLEQVKEYKLSILNFNDRLSKSDAAKFLKEEEVAVGALDSSTYNPGPHVTINISIVNVGYWYMNYHMETGGSDNYAKLIPSIGGRVDEELAVKDIELEVINMLIEKLSDRRKFLLLDESLSLIYTLSWTAEAREQMAFKTKKIIDETLKHDIIPIGVYYTRVADIVRGMVTIAGEKLENIPIIPDRTILNAVLDIYSRSPLFSVYSKALQKVGLEILCFYVKLGERNVIRVEFPAEAKKAVDNIHLLIILQSILGNGYPLAMQRAHEMAVLGANERRVIEEEVCRKLGIPAIEYILSKKAVSKRWPIA